MDWLGRLAVRISSAFSHECAVELVCNSIEIVRKETG
ncbi:MAG: hypothetical protein K0S98_425 [Propionibacteriaceae bacterium]|jgi:hypothetical protein|nr:hypothetical protein [Propionibacteriaceae bacterium]